jgi:hypothetical protein
MHSTKPKRLKSPPSTRSSSSRARSRSGTMAAASQPKPSRQSSTTPCGLSVADTRRPGQCAQHHSRHGLCARSAARARAVAANDFEQARAACSSRRARSYLVTFQRGSAKTTSRRSMCGSSPSVKEFSTKFEMAVNLKTAKALGLAVHLSILLRASEVIE